MNMLVPHNTFEVVEKIDDFERKIWRFEKVTNFFHQYPRLYKVDSQSRNTARGSFRKTVAVFNLFAKKDQGEEPRVPEAVAKRAFIKMKALKR